MRRFCRIGLSLAVSVAMLAGCGGNDGGAAGQGMKSQLRPSKSVKAANPGASAYQPIVQELYIAYFGRPADPAGLSSFENALLAANAPTDIGQFVAAYSTNPAVKSLVDSFGASAESTSLYGSGNTGAFVTAVFQNVLGRAPQQAGLTFWTGAIDSGAVSQGNAAMAIMAGAFANTTAQGQLDAQLINNHLAVAEYFTAQISSRNGASSYTGPSAASATRTLLGKVTATTNIRVFQESVDSAVTSMLPAVQPTVLSSCTSISSPGTYTLTQGLVDSSAPNNQTPACINIANTSNVTLDCAGFGVTGAPPLAVTNVQNFTITKCNFQIVSLYNPAINISGSSNGKFYANTYSRILNPGGVPSYINVTDSSSLVFNQNIIFGYFQQTGSSNNLITNNKMIAEAGTDITPALISSTLGTNNQITSNTLEGSWNHVRTFPNEENGSDDGILLEDEIGADVENNTISNVFDCGIEWSGTLAYATISGNSVTSAYTCGYGGWYYQNTIGSTFSNNSAAESGSLFAIWRIWGMQPAATPALAQLGVGSAIIFKDNTFTGNVATNSSASQLIFGDYSELPLYDYMGYSFGGSHLNDVEPTQSSFIISNNTFTNNKFGNLSDAPMFGENPMVPGYVVDGGGNVCGAHLWATAYPLVCN